MWRAAIAWHVAVWCALLLALPGNGRSYAAEALRIEVLRGDGANNNPAAAGEISAVVRVWDADGHPVAGALVVFSPPLAGASVVFAGFQSDATALTDDSGIAVAPRTRPAGANGPLEIRVTACWAGHSAAAVIRQINLGVGAVTHDERELNVVERAAPLPPGRRRVREATMLVRVEDGKGLPVASAKVLFVLRRAAGGSEPLDLGSQTATSATNGEADVTLTVPAPLGDSGLEFMVRAEFNGRRATRFFPVTQ
ncbi:MAG: hypothetical protein ABSG65_01895 [Bryobacteraceae bacterium]|jgi:hypothetical protein